MHGDSLDDLRRVVARFRDERDWAQFHSPRNLAMAISIEASELLEHFLWRDGDDVLPDKHQDVADEMADVLAYLLSLADVLGIDLGQALLDKVERNAQKYPATLVRGSARKYTEYTSR
jgi:NTP pyrophosphatase (non-canonical NTP hydrolase)